MINFLLLLLPMLMLGLPLAGCAVRCVHCSNEYWFTGQPTEFVFLRDGNLLAPEARSGHPLTGWPNISLYATKFEYYSHGGGDGRGQHNIGCSAIEAAIAATPKRIYLFSQILFALRFLLSILSCSCTHSAPASRILVCLMYFCVCVSECDVHACISCAIITTTILFIASVLHYLFFFFSRSIPFNVCVYRLRVRFSFIFLSFDGFGLIFRIFYSDVRVQSAVSF